ncbi:hypothetical protein TgHK011_003581 [Trichoderma gracile]|nr:hypothetical protein TgHK011_003581 [Trichoderma gracile]
MDTAQKRSDGAATCHRRSAPAPSVFKGERLLSGIVATLIRRTVESMAASVPFVDYQLINAVEVPLQGTMSNQGQEAPFDSSNCSTEMCNSLPVRALVY